MLPNDPWEDGRTLEWTIPSPPPEYNFKQTPLVRGYDAYWKEKMDGNTGMTPAEPIGSIHMPSPSILPFFHVNRIVHCRLRLDVSHGDWGKIACIDTGYIVGVIRPADYICMYDSSFGYSMIMASILSRKNSETRG